jgi:hypothetical protein
MVGKPIEEFLLADPFSRAVMVDLGWDQCFGKSAFHQIFKGHAP